MPGPLIRFALEALFLVLVAVGAGTAKFGVPGIVLVMSAAWVVVALFERSLSQAASRNASALRAGAGDPRPAEPDGQPPPSHVHLIESSAGPAIAPVPLAGERAATAHADPAPIEPQPVAVQPEPVAAEAQAPAPVAPEPVAPVPVAPEPEAERLPEPASAAPEESVPEPEPEPEPTPAAQVEPEPAAPPAAPAPVVHTPPPAPVLQSVPPLPPEPVRMPEPQPEPSTVVQFVPSGPRTWNLWELERIARDRSGDDAVRDEERSFMLMYLREFAAADGALPTDFDPLVRETFGDLLGAVT